MKRNRDPGIELLRCLLMFLIVLYHSFWCGAYGHSTEWWTCLFLVGLIWHVDAFIGISGWFGIKCKPSKVIRLVGLMAWTSFLSVGYLFVFDRSHFSLKSIGIQGGWFGETYLMFLFVVPFVNMAIERLQEESAKVVLSVWGVLACAYALTWAPGHLLLPFSPRGVSGSCLFLFCFIYLTMRLVKANVRHFNSVKYTILRGGGLF